MQRFELLLSHDYTASSTGLYIQSLPIAERVTCVLHAIEGKAEATLKKRLAASSKYVQFCCSAGMSGFPFDVQPVLQYTSGLMESTRVHGALTGFMEASGFLVKCFATKRNVWLPEARCVLLYLWTPVGLGTIPAIGGGKAGIAWKL